MTSCIERTIRAYYSGAHGRSRVNAAIRQVRYAERLFDQSKLCWDKSALTARELAVLSTAFGNPSPRFVTKVENTLERDAAQALSRGLSVSYTPPGSIDPRYVVSRRLFAVIGCLAYLAGFRPLCTAPVEFRFYADRIADDQRSRGPRYAADMRVVLANRRAWTDSLVMIEEQEATADEEMLACDEHERLEDVQPHAAPAA